jgi:squalene-hopene/tetraprenyl-beta-curcumene cyclase
MESSRNVRVVSTDTDDNAPSELTENRPTRKRSGAPLRRAILRTRQWLFGQQQPDGHWVGELEGDTILESEYILLLAYLGREDTELARKTARHLIRQQLPEGGWAAYPGGPVEVSASVKAYFALKLTGPDPSEEYMLRARAAVLAHGGADAVNSFTRFYLALLGQISYAQCPCVPPEAVLLPKWFPVNLYAVSAWSRTIIVPLSIMSAFQPVTAIEPSRGIRELFLKAPEDWPELRCPGLKGSRGLVSWDRFFRTVDHGFKWCQRHRVLPLRRRALAAAGAWMRERFEGSDGLGAIFPPMVWSIIALKCLGYDDESPEVRYCHEQLAGLVIEEDDTARLQPCKSPVWDTAITVRALAASGVEPRHPAIHHAIGWLLDRQITQRGDWSESVPAEPAGWCFEHANAFYPDVDDTAMVLMALGEQFESPTDPGHCLPPTLHLVAEETAGSLDQARARVVVLEKTAAATERAIRWLLAMQNRDGGWGAFDRNNDREFLCYVPFADHNAMIDPSTPDVTARVLESLGQLGRRIGDPVVDRAVDYLRRTQEADGSWFGRWGVNYVYGTWQALAGLVKVGIPHDDPVVVAGVHWLLACQQPSGAWGESPDSYANPHLRGQGPATPTQTAWAVLGLLAAGYENHPAVARGIGYLVACQRDDGGWDEPEFTGTGFPRVFYLRYHLYPIYFPLMALSRWAVATGTEGESMGQEDAERCDFPCR